MTRLEPPYILCLVLLVLAKLAFVKGSVTQYLPHFLASAFYLHNSIYGTFSSINVVAWSLEIEVQFYVLAPLLAAAFFIRSREFRRLIMCLLVIGATGLSQMVRGEPRLALSLLGYSQYFLVGLLFADFHTTADGPAEPKWKWDFISVIGWPMLLVALCLVPVVAVWIAPWLILILYHAGLRGPVFNSFFANPLIATIGGMCYSIYLLHNYLVYGLGTITESPFRTWGFEARLAVQFLLMAPIVLLVSALYFRFIERPCMRPDWPRRGLQRVGTMVTDLRNTRVMDGSSCD